jgi:hypothetical protein
MEALCGRTAEGARQIGFAFGFDSSSTICMPKIRPGATKPRGRKLIDKAERHTALRFGNSHAKVHGGSQTRR